MAGADGGGEDDDYMGDLSLFIPPEDSSSKKKVNPNPNPNPLILAPENLTAHPKKPYFPFIAKFYGRFWRWFP